MREEMAGGDWDGAGCEGKLAVDDVRQDLDVCEFREDGGEGLVEADEVLVDALEEGDACDELGGAAEFEDCVLVDGWAVGIEGGVACYFAVDLGS